MRLPAVDPSGRAQALVLAAGRGERMRPLTDHCPKPLLPVQGRPLLRWHLDALARAGYRHAVVNTGWLGEQIAAYLGAEPMQRRVSWPLTTGAGAEEAGVDDRFTLDLSPEMEDFGYALETLGGISRALPQLGEVFWVVAGDVFLPDFDFPRAAFDAFARSGRLAHLWLVPNPPHHPQGDFGLEPAADRYSARALNLPTPTGLSYTFSTVALYRRALFEAPWCTIIPGNPQGTAAPLAPLLRRAIAAGVVSAEVWAGAWTDVGTPERLAEVQGSSAR